MEPQIQSPFMRFHVMYPFVTVLGALGALAGGLIGALTGNLDAGIAAGFVVGIVAGLIVGLHVMKHLKRGSTGNRPRAGGGPGAATVDGTPEAGGGTPSPSAWPPSNRRGRPPGWRTGD